MALLVFLLAAARARVVAADILERVACRLLVRVVAVRAMHMTVVMLVVVVAVGAVNVGFLMHGGHSGM
jgi:hypothetical protein